jgi:hypothetical protein
MRQLIITLGVLGGLLNTLSAQASSLGLNYLGQSIIPTGTQYGGTTVGGLSGITYNPANDSFYTISDDRSQINPARFYTASIDPTLFNANGVNNGVTFTGVTTLLQSNGQPFPTLSLDPEGIAVVNGGQVFVSSEGNAQAGSIIDPFVNRFGVTTGQENAALPVNYKFNPAFSVANQIALERSFAVGAATTGNTGNTVKIFQVSLAGASNIINNNSLIASGTAGIIPAQKTLLFDLTNLDIPIDNVQGITFGETLPNGKRSLILVSDNNFDATQFTQFLAFEIESVPESSTVLGVIAVGIGGFLVFKKRKFD